MIGQTLGHYRITEQIVAGGMGVVYRARDGRLDRDVAIKVLPGDALADEAARRRFRNEAPALSRTSHPNIATVHDFDSQAGVHFLVMEYIPGVTLGERLAGGALPESEVLRLGIGLADGLAAAHAQGVIHRDLKPSNLRLTFDGRLKILDFGIARLRPVSAETTHTDSGNRPIGTLPYMSPEQVRGLEADARSDIYSAGAVLYEMATGRRAHPGRQDAEVIDAILHETPPAPNAAGARISPALAAILVPRRGARIEPSGQGTRLRLAVLPAQDLTARQGVGEWPGLIQALFAGELTGLQDVGVMDPLSLNSLMERATTAGGAPGAERFMALLREAKVDLVIDSQLVRAAGGYELRANLLDPSNGEIRFSSHAALTDEQALGQRVAALADAIVSYLQVQVLAVSRDKDLRPWISFRSRNIEAVRAFLQANQYLFRNQLDEADRYGRRAVELDPSFIAPRLWLISSLLGRGQRAEAEEHQRHLRSLEARAGPFEQTMIAYTDAMLRGDREAQARYLEIALNYSPGNNILLVNLATVRAQMGDCKRALAVLEPVVAARWQYPPIFPLRGWCAIAEGRVDEARTLLEAALSVEPVHPYVYGLLDALLIAEDRPDEAARFAKLYEEGRPTAVTVNPRAVIAMVHRTRGRPGDWGPWAG